MKKLLALMSLILAILVLLPVLQTCNVPALQAQAMIEQAQASAEIAKAAQQAANSANTLAWTLGGSVALLTLGLLALVGLWIFLRMRRELRPQEPAMPVARPRLLPRQPDRAQLASGDPIQQLIQLQTLQMLQNMNQRAPGAPAQLPAPREWKTVDEEIEGWQ
mgnify:CR=1 FL=1